MDEKKRVRFVLFALILTIVMSVIMIVLESSRPVRQQKHKTAHSQNAVGKNDPPAVHSNNNKDNAETFSVIKASGAAGETGVTLVPGLTLFLDSKRIEFSAVAVASTYPLEFFVCSGDEKAHETVAVTFVSPRDIHTAMLALGARDKRNVPTKGGGTPATTIMDGDRVVIEMFWEENGLTRFVIAEDLIYYDKKLKETMPHTGWIFSGSEIKKEVDPDTSKLTGREMYMASINGTLVATYHDITAVFNNPLSIGSSDEIFFPNDAIMPPVGTNVTVVIRVPTEIELELLRANESKFERKIELERNKKNNK